MNAFTHSTSISLDWTLMHKNLFFSVQRVQLVQPFLPGIPLLFKNYKGSKHLTANAKNLFSELPGTLKMHKKIFFLGVQLVPQPPPGSYSTFLKNYKYKKNIKSTP